MRTWVKIGLVILVAFALAVAVISLFFEGLLPALKGTLVAVYGGLAAGIGGFTAAAWTSMAPFVLPNLGIVFLGTVFVSGVVGMYFGHRITSKARQIIGLQARKQIISDGGFQTAPLYSQAVAPAIAPERKEETTQ